MAAKRGDPEAKCAIPGDDGLDIGPHNDCFPQQPPSLDIVQASLHGCDRELDVANSFEGLGTSTSLFETVNR